MATQKHFKLEERIIIEQQLNKSVSFKGIGRDMDRDCTTISKEVRNHRVFKKSGGLGRPFNDCSHRYTCEYSNVCVICTGNPHRPCRCCSKCLSDCPDYKKEICHALGKAPYVCNNCKQRTKCTLEKVFYYAKDAQEEYKLCLSESRSGITINEAQVKHLDEFISPLIQRGQSIHHICAHNLDTIMCSEKTIYNYIDCNLFSARNIDLTRKVKYRLRKNKKVRFKIDKACRIDRTYNDFVAYMAEHPDTPIVEIDSVEGIKGGKVLLTIHFTASEFMLAYIRDANDSQSVINIFNRLYLELRPDVYLDLFQLLLGDNGSEFSNPKAIEFDGQENRRSRLYYCDPSAPYQKGAAENNHEFIRRVIPKGKSMDNFTQDDIDLMMNHINSYGRKKLGDKSPYEAFEFIYGKEILNKFGCKMISPNDIILQPSLLKK